MLPLMGVAQTAPKEVSSSLSLEELVAAAQRENPQLRSMRAKWGAMMERPVQERTLPNPMFMYRGMDEVERGDFPHTNEKRLELEQSFPWFGKLGLRGNQIKGWRRDATGKDAII